MTARVCIEDVPAPLIIVQNANQELSPPASKSMPSHNVDYYARASETVPLSTFGQMKPPRSSGLA
jgi:hypothetical protein